MADLCLYLGITLVGYLIGTRVRPYQEKLRWVGPAQTVFIFALVLMMGMKMGANEEITAHLSSIGIAALVITLFTLVFSIAGIFLVRKLMHIDRYGLMQDKHAEAAPQPETHKPKSGGGINKMTLVIVLAVAAGITVGGLVIRPLFADSMEVYDHVISLCIKIGLCLLLVFVGVDLGLDVKVVENFKKVGLRVVIFPAVVVVATLVGAACSAPLTGLSLRESLSIGAGFGWYTLAPGIIMDAGLVTASAVAFLHNVLRELLSILLIPLVAEKVGYIETTGMPGAAAMDVCLPIVEKSTRSEIAVYSFVSGVILSALVPVLVPLVLSLPL